MEDELNIYAYFYGGPERAIDIAQFSKEFLEYLETVSPWERPFDISGDRRSTADMPVREDYSNFYDLLYLAWKSKKAVYYDSAGVRGLTFSEYHTSPLGFSISFSDLVRSGSESNAVSVGVRMGSEFRKNLKGRNLHNTVRVSIRKFNEGERNSSWVERDVVESIMLRLISELDPDECSAFSSKNTVHEIDGTNFRHKFNWLTYISDQRACAVLSNNRYATEFNNGLWFEFGRNVDTVFKPEVREAAEEIGRQLLAQIKED